MKKRITWYWPEPPAGRPPSPSASPPSRQTWPPSPRGAARPLPWGKHSLKIKEFWSQIQKWKWFQELSHLAAASLARAAFSLALKASSSLFWDFICCTWMENQLILPHGFENVTSRVSGLLRRMYISWFPEATSYTFLLTCFDPQTPWSWTWL